MVLQELLLSCRRVSIYKLRLDAAIGVYDDEKDRTQPIIIDIDAYVDLAKTTPKRDDLSEVFDYNLLRNIAHEVVHQGHIHLLETIADQMAEKVLQLPMMKAVRVAVQKPTTFADCDAVGVETFRFKDVDNDARN